MMRRAVVLDRDGVINANDRPVNRPEELILYPHTSEAIRRLNKAGFLVLVATNQGGVGLGYLSKDDLDRIHDKMLHDLETEGARIDGIAACIHAPHAGCDCRKPKPGLIDRLQRRYRFDRASSFMVGDRETDVQAGRAAGLRTIYIGEGPSEADCVAPNLLEAVKFILASPDGRASHTMG